MKLDIGCGPKKPAGWTGMDRVEHEGVDITHDWRDLPWPLEDGEAEQLRASHVLEHVCPLTLLDWMDEAWRVLEAGGTFHVAVPHAGTEGDYQDPTHCAHFNAATWRYFDPDYELYSVYEPRPWKVERLIHNGPNIDVVLVKRAA